MTEQQDTPPATAPSTDEWAIVEIMGHLRRAGRISEADRFGARLLRVDVPTGPDEYVTEYFSGSAIYRLRPATEEVARAVAEQLGDPRPAVPVAYRLPAPGLHDDDEDERELDFDERPF